ncbi:hypothetical protein HYW99_03735, partial [Candidatus Woesearchaeota archaeon]|nr:hypothetical protein [Candidatus Woesearchaeota archaeon]
MAIKRGLFFTVDSLLASGIIIVMILLVSNFYFVEHENVNINYASQDLVRVFSNMKIADIDNPYVKNLTLEGKITNLNNTILEQIGDFWASGNLDLASNFTKNITDEIIPDRYGFSVLVDGEEIYSRDLPLKKSLVSTRKMISGIAKAKPTEGFTARVLLSGINSKRTNSYVFFGGFEGEGNLTKKLMLPTSIISFNSSYIEVDSGNTFDLYINRVYSGTYIKGTGSGGTMLADKWNISNAYLSNFVPGENIITINFTGNGSNYIAGGFLRVNYLTSLINDTQKPGYETYNFPGIDGLINLYSAIYFPEEPSFVNASLHFISPYGMYLTLGNTTVFETNGTLGEQIIILNDSNFSSKLNYTLLDEKTLPLRLGLKTTSLILGPGAKADAVLITDRTGSMDACDIIVNCTSGLCDSNPTGGCHDRRDNVAINSDKKFVDTILSNQGNKVALVGFGKDLNPVCDFHDFSNDNEALKYRISNYSNEWCGYTCISCGIVASTELLIENEMLYGTNESSFTNTTQFRVRNTATDVSVTEKFEMNVDKSRFIKSRLTILGKGVDTEDNYKDCVYFNRKYLGRMCESSESDLGWHTCSFPIKADMFSDNGKNNVTITGGDTAACFGTSGTTQSWNFKDVKVSVWHSSSIPYNVYNKSLNEVQIGDSPYQQIATVNLNVSFDRLKVKAASLEFEAIDIAPNYYDCIYINGNFVGRVDYQKWNGTNQWQKVPFDIPVLWLNNGQNEINFTSGTTSGCKRTSGDNDEWRFRNVNLSVIWTDEAPNYDRSKSMLVMSVGEANTKIGDCSGCDSAGAKAETIQKACEANDVYGIKIYTVAFGNVGQNAINTLNQSACCDDCSHFYTSNNSDDLINIYEQIAESIISIGFQGQTLNVSGQNLNSTTLYPDSYLSFNYTPNTNVYVNKLPLRFETDRFGN